jgi:beta propeller repeat protein
MFYCDEEVTMRGNICIILIMIFMLSLTLFIRIDIKSADGDGVEYNITNDLSIQGNPAIYMDRIVWMENVQENGKTNWEIFLYDLSVDSDSDGLPNYMDSDDDDDGTPDAQDADLDPAKFRITNDPTNQTNPAIYDNTLVWEDRRHGNYDIYSYDLEMDTDGDDIPNYMDDNRPDPDPAEKRITENLADQEEPAVYGTKIVWMDSRLGNKDVFIYDMISKKETLIAGLNEISLKPPLQTQPNIYGDKIVWEEKIIFEDSEIYLYNLSVDSDGDGVPNYLDENRPDPDPAEVKITDNTQSDLQPVIYGNTIVFSRSNNIYLYDLESKTEHRLTNSTAGQKIDGGLCSIHGKKVVWVYDNGTKDVYLYDLALDYDGDGEPNYIDEDDDDDGELDEYDPDDDTALIQITDESEKISMTPVVYANRIVWQDKRNMSKAREIYIFTQTDNLPPKLIYSHPGFESEIVEGESLRLNVSVNDPEAKALSYSWFLDEALVLEEENDYYDYKPDYNSAGNHEVKVVVTDEEYPVEKIWLIEVAESGLEPLEIVRLLPSTNPEIIEGESITLSIWVNSIITGDVSVNWSWPDDPIFSGEDEITTTNGIIHSKNTYHTYLDYNSSNDRTHSSVTVDISQGVHSINHTWTITVLLFDDADMDGYTDIIEINYNSDPKNKDSQPMDTDSDFIVDAEDKDTDGDGLLDKHDSYPLDINKQLDANPDYSIEILVMVLSLILIIVALGTLPNISKRKK